MMIPQTITGPAAWAAYLINEDASGLSPAEKSQADAWLAREAIPRPCSMLDQSERFTWSLPLYAPECQAQGGHVVDYVYLKTLPKPEEPKP